MHAFVVSRTSPEPAKRRRLPRLGSHHQWEWPWACGPDMKIPADIFAKFAIAFKPPANEQELSFLFRRRVAGMSLPVLRIENIRLTRQLRSINKKLFLDGVKVGHLDRQTYYW
jgi:hypothetical protein